MTPTPYLDTKSCVSWPLSSEAVRHNAWPRKIVINKMWSRASSTYPYWVVIIDFVFWVCLDLEEHFPEMCLDPAIGPNSNIFRSYVKKYLYCSNCNEKSVPTLLWYKGFSLMRISIQNLIGEQANEQSKHLMVSDCHCP